MYGFFNVLFLNSIILIKWKKERKGKEIEEKKTMHINLLLNVLPVNYLILKTRVLYIRY